MNKEILLILGRVGMSFLTLVFLYGGLRFFPSWIKGIDNEKTKYTAIQLSLVILIILIYWV